MIPTLPDSTPSPTPLFPLPKNRRHPTSHNPNIHTCHFQRQRPNMFPSHPTLPPRPAYLKPLHLFHQDYLTTLVSSLITSSNPSTRSNSPTPTENNHVDMMEDDGEGFASPLPESQVRSPSGKQHTTHKKDCHPTTQRVDRPRQPPRRHPHHRRPHSASQVKP